MLTKFHQTKCVTNKPCFENKSVNLGVFSTAAFSFSLRLLLYSAPDGFFLSILSNLKCRNCRNKIVMIQIWMLKLLVIIHWIDTFKWAINWKKAASVLVAIIICVRHFSSHLIWHDFFARAKINRLMYNYWLISNFKHFCLVSRFIFTWAIITLAKKQ